MNQEQKDVWKAIQGEYEDTLKKIVLPAGMVRLGEFIMEQHAAGQLQYIDSDFHHPNAIAIEWIANQTISLIRSQKIAALSQK